jgi:hypothetical protein
MKITDMLKAGALLSAGLLLSPALLAQVVTLIPTCGKVGDKICISGNSWAEPNPLCRYIFSFDPPSPNTDGLILAPDQQDGVYGPPSTNFTVPSASLGNHKVGVRLVLDDASSTQIQTASAPFKVVDSTSGAGSMQPGPAGTNNFSVTYNVPLPCVRSCKRIVFIQTVQRTVVKTDGTTVITSATDWNGNPDAADKASVETTPSHTRVDMAWSLSAPYYNQGDNGVVPPAGGTAGYGMIGSTTPSQINGSMADTPANSFINFKGTFPIKETVVNFTNSPFCIDGDDAGKYLGFLVTWQDVETSATSGAVVKNISVTTGQPSADFLQAVSNWVSASAHSGFSLPKPMPVTMCSYN